MGDRIIGRDSHTTVVDYLQQHSVQGVWFGDDDAMDEDEDDLLLEWLEVEKPPYSEFGPRLFAETLGLKQWRAVVDYVFNLEKPPWWWDEPETLDKVKTHFIHLIEKGQPPASEDVADRAAPST